MARYFELIKYVMGKAEYMMDSLAMKVGDRLGPIGTLFLLQALYGKLIFINLAGFIFSLHTFHTISSFPAC